MLKKELEEKLKRAVSLIDGVYEIVEIWGAGELSPSQRKWKEEWLRKARELGAYPE